MDLDNAIVASMKPSELERTNRQIEHGLGQLLVQKVSPLLLQCPRRARIVDVHASFFQFRVLNLRRKRVIKSQKLRRKTLQGVRGLKKNKMTGRIGEVVVLLLNFVGAWSLDSGRYKRKPTCTG